MRPTNESGIAKAATGIGTWFVLSSGSPVRVLLPLTRVEFRTPGIAVRRQKCGTPIEGRLAVLLSEKLGDIDLCPEASSISRYIPILFVTFGRALHSKQLVPLGMAGQRLLKTCNVVMYDPALWWIKGVTASPQLVVPFRESWKSVSQSLNVAVEFLKPFVVVVELAVQLAIKASPGPKTVPTVGLDQET